MDLLKSSFDQARASWLCKAKWVKSLLVDQRKRYPSVRRILPDIKMRTVRQIPNSFAVRSAESILASVVTISKAPLRLRLVPEKIRKQARLDTKQRTTNSL